MFLFILLYMNYSIDPMSVSIHVQYKNKCGCCKIRIIRHKAKGSIVIDKLSYKGVNNLE